MERGSFIPEEYVNKSEVGNNATEDAFDHPKVLEPETVLHMARMMGLTANEVGKLE